MTSNQTTRARASVNALPVRHRKPPTRNMPVDTLRGLACILLVTFHVIGDTASEGIHVSDDSAWRYYTDSVEYLRMPLFTLLSGLVYAWRPLTVPSKYRGFMAKKARRLLVPYVIFVPLLGLTQMVIPDVNSTVEFEPVNWLLTSLSPYWFLLTTFWIFAVVALADSYGLLRSPWVFGGVFLAVSTIVILQDTASFELFQLGPTLTLLPFFLAGIGIHRFRLLPRSVPATLGWTAALLALVAAVQLSLNGYLPEFDSRHSVVGITLGIVFPVTFLGWALESKILAWIGGYSSGIFLLHSFAVGFFRVLTDTVGIEATLPHFIILSLAGLLGSVLGIIILRRFRIGPVMVGRIMLSEKGKK
ncbi:acyltransferase family protein [Corynebacterium variabile]|uniref:acyltransferase family protein n=1 Tax=Corynebacterium variabile TaxID=1727 RepID=UPI003FD0E1D9